MIENVAKQLFEFYEKTQAQEALQDRLVSMVENLATGLANKNTTQTVTDMAQEQLRACAQVQSAQTMPKSWWAIVVMKMPHLKTSVQNGNPL